MYKYKQTNEGGYRQYFILYVKEILVSVLTEQKIKKQRSQIEKGNMYATLI